MIDIMMNKTASDKKSNRRILTNEESNKFMKDLLN